MPSYYEDTLSIQKFAYTKCILSYFIAVQDEEGTVGKQK